MRRWVKAQRILVFWFIDIYSFILMDIIIRDALDWIWVLLRQHFKIIFIWIPATDFDRKCWWTRPHRLAFPTVRSTSSRTIHDSTTLSWMKRTLTGINGKRALALILISIPRMGHPIVILVNYMLCFRSSMGIIMCVTLMSIRVHGVLIFFFIYFWLQDLLKNNIHFTHTVVHWPHSETTE